MSQGPVLVYAGRGSSHSWTWLADLFDSRGVAEARFVDHEGLAEGLDGRPSLIVVSGGDGLEIASSLAPTCFRAIEERVHAGTRYVGVCAGAYLPLPSSLPPLDGLNLSSTRIRNISRDGASDGDVSPRVAVRYGSCAIIHPVRGPVFLSDGTSTFRAPLYGGPVFQEPVSDSVLFRYSSFAHDTTFQVEPRYAREVLLGAPAVISCRAGLGTLVLAGPHLEHPGYPRANNAFLELAGLAEGPGPLGPNGPPGVRHGPLARSIADLKVAVLGMERESFLVGAKLWDGGRVLQLVDAIERRSRSLDDDTAQAAAEILDRSRETLLSLGPDKVVDTDSAPSMVVEAARLCVDRHFMARRG